MTFWSTSEESPDTLNDISKFLLKRLFFGWTYCMYKFFWNNIVIWLECKNFLVAPVNIFFCVFRKAGQEFANETTEMIERTRSRNNSRMGHSPTRPYDNGPVEIHGKSLRYQKIKFISNVVATFEFLALVRLSLRYLNLISKSL